MTRATRARYTLEFKLEAVRLFKGGQSAAATAKILGISEQTLYNWIKADEDARLRAELARVKTERHLLGKATAYFAEQRE